MEPDVVVVGAGIAGLVAARDLAVRGARVSVLDAAPSVGGCIAAQQVAGLHVDAGAEAFATRGGAVRALAEELGLGGDVVAPATSQEWVHLPGATARQRGRTVPLPTAAVLGIPVDPSSPEVRLVVGRAGATRAALDRVLPTRVGVPLAPTSVADLVRARMGRRALDRLVAPVVTGAYSAPPELADAETVLPGIRALVRERGSLAGAVARLRAASPAGSAVASLAGGMHRLVTALSEDLARRGVTVRPGTAVETLTRAEGGAWRLALAGGGTLDARRVVLAAPGPVAARLLEPHVPEVVTLGGPTADVVLVTLVLDAPDLDGAPRGSGVVVAVGPSRVRTRALTHATATWRWLADAAGPGRHVLRLSYGQAEDPAGSSELLDGPRERLFAQALDDARRLLGVPLNPEQVVDAARARWPGAVASLLPGHADAAARVRDALLAHPGLWTTGAWLAGAGVAAAVADARSVASRVVLT